MKYPDAILANKNISFQMFLCKLQNGETKRPELDILKHRFGNAAIKSIILYVTTSRYEIFTFASHSMRNNSGLRQARI